MKIFLSLLLVLGLLGLLWVSRDNAWTNTLPAYRRLEPGETNPELVKVQESWPLARGTRLWFRVDETSYGEVVDTEGDEVLIEWSAGGEDWLERRQIRSSYMIKIPDKRE